MTAEIFTWYDAAGTATILTDGTKYNVRPGLDGRLWPEFDFITDEQYLRAGARVNLVKVKPRTITLPLIVYGTSATDLAANRRVLEYAFDPMRGPGRLKVTNVDAADRYLDCYCTGWDVSESYDTGDCRTFFMFVVTLMAPWPYWYSDTPTTTTFSAGAGWGPKNITNAGDAEAYPFWVITPVGGTTGVVMYNSTTYTWIEIQDMSGTLPITFITAPGNESVTDSSGVNCAGALTNTTTLFPLISGVNSIEVSYSGTAPTSVVCGFYPQYLGV